MTAAALARELYAALDTGQDATIARLLHPRARLRVPGDNPLSGTYTGTAGLQEFSTLARTIAPGGAHTTVLEILAGPTHAAVLGVSHARRAGRPDLANRTLHLLEVSGGQVIGVEIFNAEQAAVDRFWS
ncbi:nuclear transport factor 2 family protein [Granulicoccus phenolivorans]|uniref:nuclear transport factor 2 family protein n=1 Tax=Granulicoccus phenolivorans TaxID=266854 RepID=UPI00041DEE1B|nr:nuclear transport factor 2 family protein [Granulicoccus phenolivorans]